MTIRKKRARGTLERYIAILEALTALPGGMSLNEVMEATALPRGTVHRLVKSLTKVGFLNLRAGRTKIYVLGPRLLRLIYSGLSADLVAALARPILDELASEFGETVFLARLNGGHVERVTAVVPPEGTFSYVQPGRVLPFNATAAAKAILAFQDERLINDALSGKLQRFTASTKISKARLRAELKQVQREGYGVSREEFDPGVLSYACPVHLTGFGTLYSVGIVGLTERLRRHSAATIVSALKARAHALSLALHSRVKGAHNTDGRPALPRGNSADVRRTSRKGAAQPIGPARSASKRRLKIASAFLGLS
jgi:DNA-binding IclR family transcriptional regulator